MTPSPLSLPSLAPVATGAGGVGLSSRPRLIIPELGFECPHDDVIHAPIFGLGLLLDSVVHRLGQAQRVSRRLFGVSHFKHYTLHGNPLCVVSYAYKCIDTVKHGMLHK